MTTLQSKSSSRDEKSKSAFALSASEFLFIALPLLIVTMVHILQDTPDEILARPEWAFATIVLVGQTIVRVVSGLLASHQTIIWQRTALVLSILIVLLLIPAAILLAFVLILESLPTWVVVTNMVLFLVSTLLFLFFNALGFELLHQ